MKQKENIFRILNAVQIYAAIMVFLIISAPVAFAISIDVDSISVTEVTDSSVKIRWNTDVIGTGQVDYGIYSSSLNSIPELGGLKVSHEVPLNGLSSGTSYFYKLKSQEQNLLTSETGFYQFSTLLSSPSGLKTVSVKHNTADISWNSIPNAKSYKIYLNNIYKQDASGASASIIGLIPKTAYNIAVSSVDNGDRESAQSSIVSFTTSVVPTNISFVDAVLITDSSAVITWKTSEALESLVRYDSDINLDQEESDSALTKDHSVALSNLVSDTRYYYTVSSAGTVSERKSFLTLPKGVIPKLEFSDISVGQIGLDSAVITWKTSLSSLGKIEYGTDDKFSSTISETAESVEHSLKLDNLLSSTKYYFRIVSSQVISDYKSFGTTGNQQIFLKLDTVADITRLTSINVSGTTRLNARVYIFANGNSEAIVKETIIGTRFSFPVSLSSMANNQGKQGNNYILVRTWDAAGNTDSKAFYVLLDRTPPSLNIYSPIPDITRINTLNISGTSEIGADVKFYVQEKLVGELNKIKDVNFTKSLNIGSFTNVIIKIIVSDFAGNKNTFEKLIRFDNTAPTIVFDPDSFVKTHFKLYAIRGKTEPGAEVKVVNYGKYKSCDEAASAGGYISCDKFLEQDQTIINIDPISYGLGMVRSTTAGSDGVFVLTVSLLASEINKDQNNNLEFFATDLAGNTAHSGIKSITYSPGCSDWVLGTVESMPFNIYTTYLSQGNIRGSAVIPIKYLGSGVPIIKSAEVYEDTSSRGYVPFKSKTASIGTLGQNKLEFNMASGNKWITVGQPKSTKYNEKDREFVVFTYLNIPRYNGPIVALPDQINGYLSVKITYQVPNSGTTLSTGTCYVYPTVSFDVQKPELLTKWLSPDMINRTIHTLDKMINATQKTVDIVNKATQYTLVACGVMVVYSYLSGFAGTNTEAVDNNPKCTQQQDDMEKLYWVCDRVLCPAAPPKCGDFRIDDGKKTDGGGVGSNIKDYEDQRIINEKWRIAYERDTTNGKGTFEDWKKNKLNDDVFVKNNGKYNPLSSSSFTFENTETKTTTNMRLFAVGSDGKILDKSYLDQVANAKIINFAGQQTGQIQIENQLTDYARTCSGGTIIRYMDIQNEGTSGKYIGTTKIGSYNYECMKGKSPDQIPLDSSSLVKGCYNAGCPQFDKTKCFNKAGINPPEDLFSSFGCACLPAILSHLKNYLKIMVGAKKCLEQALIGETRAGFCERLLAQFVCDLLTQAFRFILSTVDENSYQSGGAIDGIRGSLASYKQNSALINDQLSNRYGGIVKERLGLSSDELVNKACMLAITGDWEVLDGLFENFVDAVEVKPVATIYADSIVNGYDPFTGKMDIMYSVTVGVVPGGENDVRAWLECNPNLPSGKFCGKLAYTKPVPLLTTHLKKSDPAMNDNYIIIDEGAKYWMNVVKLSVTYRVGEKSEVMEITKEILQKGDLAYECKFDIISGITCDVLDGLSMNGIIELMKSGTAISPNVAVYNSNNRVAGKIKIDNQYKGDSFYLRADYPGRSPTLVSKEYKLPGANTGGAGGEELYNVWLDNVGEIQNTDGATQVISEFNTMKDFNLLEEGKLSIKFENFNLGAATTTTTLPKFIVKWKAKNIETIYQTVIQIVDSAITSNNDLIQINRLEFISGDFIIKDLSVLEKGIQFKAESIVSVEVQNLNKNTVIISSVPSITIKTNEKKYGDKRSITITDKIYTSSGSRNIELNVLEDTNSDGKGDTPILYNTGNTQKISLSYKYGAKVETDIPLVDFIEPVGQYLILNDVNPIGFNIWHPTNKIKEIWIRAIGQGALQNKFSCDFKISVTDDGSLGKITENRNNHCKLNSGERNLGFKPDSPPFFEFMLDLQDNDEIKNNVDYATIDISVQARGDKDSSWSNANGALRSFKLKDPNTTGDGFRKADLMVYLGGKELGCSPKCISYQDTSVTVAAYDASAMPAK